MYSIHVHVVMHTLVIGASPTLISTTRKSLFLCIHVCVCVQQRSGLKGREKEQMWKELLKVLRPGQSDKPKYTIPEEDDFDPDTYSRPIEQIIQGKVVAIIFISIIIINHTGGINIARRYTYTQSLLVYMFYDRPLSYSYYNDCIAHGKINKFNVT